MAKTIKAQVLVVHSRRANICQISIKEVGKYFFAVVSDYADRKKVIFKKCKTLLEAGMEYKAFIKKAESKGYKTIPVDGRTIDFAADTFDFTKECGKKEKDHSE
jgi:hypothetical protein